MSKYRVCLTHDQRNELQPWREKMWCVSEITLQYEQRMMDVLEVYERP